MYDDVTVEGIPLHIEHTLHSYPLWYGEAEYGGYHFKLVCFAFARRSWQFCCCLEHPYTSPAKIRSRIAKQKRMQEKQAA